MGVFLSRIAGALRLRPEAFEDVEADTTATPQALAVVLLASIGAGLGNTALAGFSIREVIVGVIGAIVAWVVWALLIYLLGTRVMPDATTTATPGQLLRTVGFAAAPGMFRVLDVLKVTGPLLFVVTSVWMLAAVTIGVRQALDYTSTVKAASVCVLGWLISLIIAAGIGLVFTVPVS